MVDLAIIFHAHIVKISNDNMIFQLKLFFMTLARIIILLGSS